MYTTLVMCGSSQITLYCGKSPVSAQDRGDLAKGVLVITRGTAVIIIRKGDKTVRVLEVVDGRHQGFNDIEVP